MMWSAFTSEWTKLRRPTLLCGTFLGLAAAASLFVVLLFTQASANGGIVTLHQLAQPNGLVIGVARAAMLLGVVAFGIAAAQVASEYSLGTLRQLLVRQPRRAVLLAGKMLGVITFLVLALCFAAVIALIVAVVAADSRGVPTGAWFTTAGLGDLFRELGDLALATVGYSVLGMALGQFVRSAVFAVIIGFAWLLAIENIVTRIVPSTEQWLPGASILAVASGGAEGVKYGHGLILGAVYLVVAIVAAIAVFLRSDVTA
jgi:ABC-type transport system involved in multi-copper enzyme maturation permease subunit